MKDYIFVPPVPVTLNNLNDQIRTANAKTDRLLLQNVWHEVECRRDVLRAANGAYIELAQGIKKLFNLLLTMACV
jgi:hypothetical protein